MATTLGGNQRASELPGTINRAQITNEGQILMDALKAFIVPIVRTCLSAKDPHEASSIVTPSNGEDPMLSALRTFVGHVVEAEIERQDNGAISESEGDTARGNSFVKQEGFVVPAAPSARQWKVVYNKASSLLKRSSESVEAVADSIMKRWRETIFNRWPIRVLWFGKTGPITLIGRSDVYNIVQAQLFQDLNSAQMDPDLLKAMHTWQFNPYLKKVAAYAILSHTWLQDSAGEITHKSWVDRSYDRNSAGYKKLENFCRVSASHGLQFGWMDTLCINKDSSSELDESIRSMYRWYQDSAVCITYLAETSTIDWIHRDRWFTRGWTLQELVAPYVIFFYNRNWERFTDGENDREDNYIINQIESGSGITQEELASFHNTWTKPPISRRMQWAAKRQVTREEDTAYSLMGLFDVSMSTAYGEGPQHAFARLIKKIIGNPGRGTIAMDILNCIPYNRCSETLNSKILPHGPSAFNNSVPPHELWQSFEPHIPMMITQRGLSVSALLIRGICHSGTTDLILQRTWGKTGIQRWGYTFQLLRNRFESKEGVFLGTLFAVLNHTVNNNHIFLPRTCLAVTSHLFPTGSHLELEIPSDGSTFHTESDLSIHVPVTFSLSDRTNPGTLEPIPIADLEENGLYLRTLYM